MRLVVRLSVRPFIAISAGLRYGVYYARIKDEIHILAVVHDARHPSVWRQRR
jgi:plasmid stabilization system protein ParE